MDWNVIEMRIEARPADAIASQMMRIGN